MARERVRVIHPSNDEVRTQQSHAKGANINEIIRRWRDGQPIPENHRQPQYGDFTNATSYHEALDQVHEASEQFMRLPPELRANVDNDVGLFLDKVKTEDGLKELVDLGLDGYLAPPGVEVPGHKEAVEKEKKEKERLKEEGEG